MDIEQAFMKYRKFWIGEAASRFSIARAAAEDIFTNTFLECIAKAPPILSVYYLKTRFFNRCVDYIAHEESLKSVHRAYYVHMDIGECRIHLDAVDLAVSLSKDRDLIRDKYINNTSDVDLSLELGITEEALRKRLSRARKKLRDDIRMFSELFDLIDES
jgi:hypothetical protein